MKNPRLLAIIGLSLHGGASTAVAAIVIQAVQPTASGVVNVERGMYGWQFNVLDTIHVNTLAVWDRDGDGLVSSHEVGIWRLDGTLLGSGVVPGGATAILQSGYRTIQIPTIQLTPDSYIVAAFYPNEGGSNDFVIVGANAATFSPNILWEQRVFTSDETSFEFPTSRNDIFFGNVGPAFGTVIPEPSSSVIALSTLGFYLLGRRR